MSSELDRTLDQDELPSELELGLGAGYGRSPEDDSALPSVLGDYRILREIGRGAMGVVYLAEDVGLHRRVALKVLPAHLTLQEHMIERFRIEAASAARLRHPGIVQIFHVGEQAGHHFFAMELLHGSSLHDVLQDLRGDALESLDGARLGQAVARTRLTEPVDGAQEPTVDWPRSYVEAVCRLVAQIARALQHAHEEGVIHRDVKPANILVRADGTPVLTDFGLARQEGQPQLTRTGVFLGTPHYTSPEQARTAGPSMDGRCDVFSLGVTLYELLTLRKPFEGETTVQVLDRIAKHEPPSPRRINRRLPLDVATITLKALEKDPARRYASAEELADDLEAFLRFESIAARPASFPTRVGKFVRRHVAASVATALLAVAVLSAWGWWLAQKVHLRVDSATEGATVLLDGRVAGTTNEDLLLEPGVYSMSVVKPPDLFSLEREIVLERGERQVNRIELTSFEDFRDELLGGGGAADPWLDQGVPDRFREGLEEEFRVRQRRLVERLAHSDFEAAAGIEEEIRRLDRLDVQQAATGEARTLAASAREIDRRSRRLYDEAMAAMEDDGAHEEILGRIQELRRLRFEGWELASATEDAQELTEELARRLARRVEDTLERSEVEPASRWLALLEDVDRANAQIPSLESRLGKARREERIGRLRSEAERHRDPRSADAVRLEEILAELRGLSAGAEVLADLEHAVVSARFEDWLRSSRLEAQAAEALVAGSGEQLAELARRLDAAIDLARPGLEEEPIARYAELERALDAARGLVDEVDALDTTEPAQARRSLLGLRRRSLPVMLASSRDRLLDARERQLATREQAAELVASCERDVGRLRPAEARAAHERLRALAERLPPGEASGVHDEVERLAAAIDGVERSEAQLENLLAPFALFLSNPDPIQSAEADRSLQTLRGRLEEHRRRLWAAIELGSTDASDDGMGADTMVALLLRSARLGIGIGDFDRALADAHRARAIAPSGEDALLAGRALYHAWEDQRDAALLPRAAVELERALAQSRGDARAARARYWRAMCALASPGDLGGEERALQELEAALGAGDVGAPEVHHGIAQLQLSRLAGTQTAARSSLLESVVQHANQALDGLDRIARRLESSEDLLAFEESVRRMRRDLLVLRGKAYAADEKWRAAISTFEEATEVDPNHAEIWMRLANAETGLPTDESYYSALQHLRRVESLAPDNEALLSAVTALRREIHGWLRGER